MGTVTSLTAVSRAGCDIAIAGLFKFSDLAPIYGGALLTFLASIIMFKVSKTKVKME